jgi:hypothetical protein
MESNFTLEFARYSMLLIEWSKPECPTVGHSGMGNDSSQFHQKKFGFPKPSGHAPGNDTFADAIRGV